MTDESSGEKLGQTAEEWFNGVKQRTDGNGSKSQTQGRLPWQRDPWEIRDGYARDGEVYLGNIHWYAAEDTLSDRAASIRRLGVPEGIEVRLVPEAAVDSSGKLTVEGMPKDEQNGPPMAAAVYVSLV